MSKPGARMRRRGKNVTWKSLSRKLLMPNGLFSAKQANIGPHNAQGFNVGARIAGGLDFISMLKDNVNHGPRGAAEGTSEMVRA